MRAFAAQLMMACAALAATLGASAEEPALFRVELNDASVVAGTLQRITPDDVSIDVDGSPRTLPLSSVRRLERPASEPAGAQPQGAVRLTGTDGTTLFGTDFTWEGGQGVLLRTEGRVELPIDRVRTIDWQSAAAGAAADWLASLPDATESDLVVVRKGDAFEFVECAITAVSADAVFVVIDEEKIPVKRSKVIGLHWLRAAPRKEPAPILVDVTAGRLQADKAVWSPDGLVLDGAVKLPAAMLVRVDFAAGRTVALATLTPERLDVEPYSAGSRRSTGWRAFSPRGPCLPIVNSRGLAS